MKEIEEKENIIKKAYESVIVYYMNKFGMSNFLFKGKNIVLNGYKIQEFNMLSLYDIEELYHTLMEQIINSK